MRAQHVELAGEVRAGEQVAGLGVAGDEPQRLPLAGAADQDWRMRCRQRLRVVQRPRQLIVPALIRGLVAAPHLQADLERFLQPLEPLGDRRERDAQAPGLLLIPGRADAKPRTAAGQHVERGHDLRQDSRVPVDGAGHEGDQLCPGRAAGQVSQRGVRLEHVVLRRAHHVDLEEVIHHADELEPGIVGGPGDGRQVRAEPGRARPGEVRDLQSDFHVCYLRRRDCHIEAGARRARATRPA